MSRSVKYEHRLTVRATSQEAVQLESRARASGLSLARYLVETGISSTNAPDPRARAQLEQLLFELHKVGVNLNQIARRLNGGQPVSAKLLAIALAALTETAATIRVGFGRCPACSYASQ